jgi:hypothetical protein
LEGLLEGAHGRAPRKGSVHRTQSSGCAHGDCFDAALAVSFRCSRWTKVFTKQCLALGVALWVPRSRWLLDWWREQQTAYPWIATPVATPSRCPNCGFASLFLYPSLLSRMRVGVWDTSTLFVQVDLSKAQGDGTWRANPPFFRQRAERSGTSPLRHLLQLEGCLQRTARRRAPCGGCQNISRLPQATEYQEYLAGTES